MQVSVVVLLPWVTHLVIPNPVWSLLSRPQISHLLVRPVSVTIFILVTSTAVLVIVRGVEIAEPGSLCLVLAFNEGISMLSGVIQGLLVGSPVRGATPNSTEGGSVHFARRRYGLVLSILKGVL